MEGGREVSWTSISVPQGRILHMWIVWLTSYISRCELDSNCALARHIPPILVFSPVIFDDKKRKKLVNIEHFACT